MSYAKLLDDLETLQKSYAAEEDDKKIQAAADEARGDESDEDEEDELDEDGKPTGKKKMRAEKDDKEEKGNPFAKSFSGTTADGQEFEAIDGTELIKALHAEVEANKEDLTKSLTFLVSVIKCQGNLIKSLQENYIELAGQGRGRRSVSAPTFEMAKSLQDNQPLNTQGFMLKANAAFDAGRITGKDLTVCDVATRMGQTIDPALVSKVLA